MYLCPKSALFAFVHNKLDHKARDETEHVIGFVYIKWVFEYLTAFNWSVTRISVQKMLYLPLYVINLTTKQETKLSM